MPRPKKPDCNSITTAKLSDTHRRFAASITESQQITQGLEIALDFLHFVYRLELRGDSRAIALLRLFDEEELK